MCVDSMSGGCGIVMAYARAALNQHHTLTYKHIRNTHSCSMCTFTHVMNCACVLVCRHYAFRYRRRVNLFDGQVLLLPTIASASDL